MTNSSKFFYQKERHGFHLVDNSQLPVLTSGSIFLVVGSLVLSLNPFSCPFINHFDFRVLQCSSIAFLGILLTWFITVVYESGQGHHTEVVRNGLRLGMVLFILSEVMLFFSFFWAFFHVSLAPAITLGCVWPPQTIQELEVWGLPLNNTLLLLTSGLTLTLSHRALLKADNYTFNRIAAAHLFVTVVLGTTFLFCQLIEYKYGITFSWSENVFGSIFYVTTGFHGLHVIIGTLFLIFCLIRLVITTLNPDQLHTCIKSHAITLSQYSFRKEQHIGFEAAAWYWHFVDVVWIFLFLTIYWWNAAPVANVSTILI